MLDTVRVKYPIKPTDEQLECWKHTSKQDRDGVPWEKYIYNFKVDDALYRYTFYPIGYAGNPVLTLEVSLPKAIFGNNYLMISDIEEAIEIINEKICTIPFVPILDIGEGKVIRLDMCYNHQVGDTVQDYIRALSNLEYPHRRTKHHRFEGVEYRTKHKTTKFYDKERESKDTKAKGILRQETTLMKPKDAQKFIGGPPTLQNLTKEKVFEYLREDLEKLGLLGKSIATRSTALAIFAKEYGSNACVYSYGLLMLKKDKPKKMIAQETEMHPRTLDRKLKAMKDAGVPLTLTDRKEPLPPLSIDND
jgi:hypothetical protein